MQEVFVDPDRDESLIFELLDLKGEVDDAGSALWFLRDIANEQDAGDNMVNKSQLPFDLPTDCSITAAEPCNGQITNAFRQLYLYLRA